MALGQGPRRPRRKRARGSVGARGGGGGATEAVGGRLGAAVMARGKAGDPVFQSADDQPKGCGVLDRPVKPGDDGCDCREVTSAQSCPSSVSPPETSTLPGAGSRLSFLTTPSSTSIE